MLEVLIVILGVAEIGLGAAVFRWFGAGSARLPALVDAGFDKFFGYAANSSGFTSQVGPDG